MSVVAYLVIAVELLLALVGVTLVSLELKAWRKDVRLQTVTNKYVALELCGSVLPDGFTFVAYIFGTAGLHTHFQQTVCNVIHSAHFIGFLTGTISLAAILVMHFRAIYFDTAPSAKWMSLVPSVFLLCVIIGMLRFAFYMVWPEQDCCNFMNIFSRHEDHGENTVPAMSPHHPLTHIVAGTSAAILVALLFASTVLYTMMTVRLSRCEDEGERRRKRELTVHQRSGYENMVTTNSLLVHLAIFLVPHFSINLLFLISGHANTPPHLVLWMTLLIDLTTVVNPALCLHSSPICRSRAKKYASKLFRRIAMRRKHRRQDSTPYLIRFRSTPKQGQPSRI